MSCKTSWWLDLLAHWAPSGSGGSQQFPLRLAIRKDYINFYSSGQSIAKILFRGRSNTPMLEIHQKYVKGEHAKEQQYLKLSADEGADADGRLVAWGGREMLRKWISNSCTHRGIEKPRIEAVVAGSSTVIDLEMGLPAVDGRKGALRMDIVSLERATDGIQIVFWEGKMIGDKRLRSKVSKPGVVDQINAYESYLKMSSRRRCIVEAYRETCRIIRELHCMASRLASIGPLDPLILAAAEPNNRLDVEKRPRLVVFDDGEKRRDDIWQGHLDVLRKRVPVAVVAHGTTAPNLLELITGTGNVAWGQSPSTSRPRVPTISG